jgi:hypothetical protein
MSDGVSAAGGTGCAAAPEVTGAETGGAAGQTGSGCTAPGHAGPCVGGAGEDVGGADGAGTTGVESSDHPPFANSAGAAPAFASEDPGTASPEVAGHGEVGGSTSGGIDGGVSFAPIPSRSSQLGSPAIQSPSSGSINSPAGRAAERSTSRAC